MSEALSFDIRDIERTVKMLNDAGKSPQKAVTRAAGRAGTILKRAVMLGKKYRLLSPPLDLQGGKQYQLIKAAEVWR